MGVVFLRFVLIDQVKEGMKIGRTIYNEKGVPLLHKGSTLSNVYINKLKIIGYKGLLIDDEISKDVDYHQNFVSQEVKCTIANKLQVAFTKTADGKQNISKNIKELRELIDDIVNDMLSSKDLTLNLIELKMFDNYTYFHSINVAIIVLVLGYHVGLNTNDLKDLGLAGLLHDIGKLFVSNEILNKPNKLTKDEFEQMKLHSFMGYKTLKKNPQLNSKICISVLNHHEHFNGKGYPNNLKGNKINLWSRIICIADVYDALTSDRPYRKAYKHSNVIEYIMANCGELFDPDLVALFLSKIYPYPVGSVVKLSNKETALVIENNDINLRPVVKTIKDERIIDLLHDKEYMSVTIEGLVTA